MLRKISQAIGSIKPLRTQASSLSNGLRVTYPNLQNKTHDIENALQTFISCLAVCQTATLRALIKKYPTAKLGNINFSKIESSYDLKHWFNGGGKDNKIGDIFVEAQIQTNLSESQLSNIKHEVQKLCPIYQMITGSGVKIHSNWKIKQLGLI